MPNIMAPSLEDNLTIGARFQGYAAAQTEVVRGATLPGRPETKSIPIPSLCGRRTKAFERPLTSILADEGYETASVSSGEECPALLDQRSAGLVLLDVWLDGTMALQHSNALRQNGMTPMVGDDFRAPSIETAVRATNWCV